jgi:hypothetical protein
MSQTAELRSSTALAITLPERVFTRSGSSFDPREDVWEWADGPFNARIDFRRYTGDFKAFVLWLKHALLPFVKGHSSAHSAAVAFIECDERQIAERVVELSNCMPWTLSTRRCCLHCGMGWQGRKL